MLAAAACAAVTVATSWLLPLSSAAALALVSVAAGLTAFFSIMPWPQLNAAVKAEEELRRLAAQLTDFAELGDRSLVPKPERYRGDVAKAIAAATEGISREGVATGRRNHFLVRRMDREVESRTEKRTAALRREASTDPLTGLANRRGMDDALARLFSEDSRRRGDTVAALSIDLDHFKPINDTLGHSAGDECLRTLGLLLQSTLRDHDVAVRIGGDEFTVLLPGLGEREAAAVGERILGLHRQLPWPHGATIDPPSLSIGVAAVHQAMADGAKLLIERSDAALYVAKRAGRSQAATWGDHLSRTEGSDLRQAG
ncbi:MAG: GGDEF domain-containing protein [Phycisphaerales bacterium]